MVKSTAITDNELVQKQKEAIGGRGKYPKMGVTKIMHHPAGGIPEMTRAQEMKGFKKGSSKFKP